MLSIIIDGHRAFDAADAQAETISELAALAAVYAGDLDGEFSLKVDGRVARPEELVADIDEGATLELVDVTDYEWPSDDEPEPEPEPEASEPTEPEPASAEEPAPAE